MNRIVLLLALLGLTLPLAVGQDPAAEIEPAPAAAEKVVLIRFGTPEEPITISPFSEAFLMRKLAEAEEIGADVVVVEIDSPGGHVESSINLATALRDIEWATTVAFIPREALSGAAIMSLGADRVMMSPTAYIGDAGPIFMDENFLFRHAPEKIRSDLVTKVRGLAEDTGRPPAVAEAMVDMDLEVFEVTHADDGRVTYMSDAELNALKDPTEWRKGPLLEASKKGQFLEVRGRRAVEIGLANELVDSRAALAARFGRQREDLTILESTWVDTLVMILNFRFVTVLLFIVGLIAAYFELAAPGIGIGGLIAGLCFGLFFWSRFLGGTAGWLEVLLFLSGIAFLLMELFVIPGFGVAGFIGILLVLTSVVMAGQRFVGSDGVSVDEFRMTAWTLAGAGVGSVIGMYVVAKYFGGIKLFKRLTLEPPAAAVITNSLAASESPEVIGEVAIGDEGVADSALRPSGRVRFGEEFRDVVTDGSYVDKGARVRVIKVSGMYITVREIT